MEQWKEQWKEPQKMHGAGVVSNLVLAENPTNQQNFIVFYYVVNETWKVVMN